MHMLIAFTETALLVLCLVSPAKAAPPGLTMPSEPVTDEEIPGIAIAGGVATSMFLGFGLGQAIEGRWHDTGWIFSLGEGIAGGALFAGMVIEAGCDFSCKSGSGVLAIGWIGLVGLRVAEVIDASVGPARHNNRVQRDRPPVASKPRMIPLVVPAPRGDGALAGLALSF